MPITLTLVADTVAELHKQMHDLMFGENATEKAVERVEAQPAPKAVKPAKARPAPPVAPPEPIVVDDVDDDETPLDALPVNADIKEAAAIKAKVLDQLQRAYAGGKVQQVRGILKAYGEGAKSLTEVDIAIFPRIQKAIENGALN